MEFGRVPVAELESIHFALPPEPEENLHVLGGQRAASPKLYLGCAKWGRKEWIGKIYPQKTKEKDFLEHYVNHYNCIELNATHYKVYDEATIGKWAAKAAGRDFLFCPKMYQGVTHYGNLQGKELITTEFLKGLMAFGEHLGPIFVQVSDAFSPGRKKELFDFLQSLPADLQFFLEVRHPSWFGDAAIRKELFGFLTERKLGAVITDTSGRRDCAHMQLTIPKAFIRYVGNSLHPTDYTRIDEWIARIQYWIDQGLEELYFFMHMHDEAFSPELTVYLVDRLNAACGLNLLKPSFLPPQTLF
ncbi:DUF72 domain-containing protein [Asinibacterium sp. OR53]|uniref:DUF72 domain-containing protein n=1 Tax=Asinibacterium sp. OR53 TaxID=925409 RepID=UPI00047D805D|nr:DUF72 domain-containing protein [Asinibacterium sp. OR53]